MSIAWAASGAPHVAAQAAPPPKPAPPATAPPPQPASPAPATPAAAPAPSQPAAPVKPAEPTAEAKERARGAYARGQTAFAQGDYVAAKQAFQQAFDAVPNPIVLLSLAESATKLGQIEEAIAAFDRYLQLRPDSADRADVEQKRAALALTPATLAIKSEPPGATIQIDAQPTGKQTPAEFQISPGQHELEVALEGYDKYVEPLQATPGGRFERQVTLQKPAPPPPVAAAAETAAPARALAKPAPKPELPTAALWVTGGLGAAGLITGTVLGFLALKEHSDYEARPTESSADRGERLALFADVGFGVGAMALVTAAVLFLTYDDVPAEAQAASLARPAQASASGPRIEFMPRVSPNAASASARIRF